MDHELEELEEIKDGESFHDHHRSHDAHRALIPQPSTHSRDPLVGLEHGSIIVKHNVDVDTARTGHSVENIPSSRCYVWHPFPVRLRRCQDS